MKKQFLKYLLAMFIFIQPSQLSYAQTRIYVKVRPAEVVTNKNCGTTSQIMFGLVMNGL